MEAATRSVNEIYVNEEILKELIELKKIEKIFNQFEENFYDRAGMAWVKIRNKKLYYVPKFHFLIADSTRWTCSRNGFKYQMDGGYQGRAMSYKEARELFYSNKQVNPLIKDNEIIINFGDGYSGGYWHCIAIKKDKERVVDIKNGRYYDWEFSDKDSIKIPVYDHDKNIMDLEYFLKENLIPDIYSEKEIEEFNYFQNLYNNKKVLFSEDHITWTEDFFSEILQGEHNEILGVSFNIDEIKKELQSDTIAFKGNLKEIFQKKYLECDYYRAEIDPYDEKIMEDPNRGHWDLWKNEAKDGEFAIKIDTSLIGRNPLADIREDGIVGIDFGTKSTIVVYQDGNDITMPMRIGSGKYKKEAKRQDFENPTVMEFRNLQDFMERYHAKKGRPETLWEDLTVSHQAAEQLKNGRDSSKYYSFFSDLKQWSGDRTRQIRIRDHAGYEQVLPAFVDIQEGDFNPIELYAYYLGLFINNMRKGIYLNYILSFPVTYEKNVREKILASFEKGLKKSLPIEVLENEAAMKKFRILQGASEPAAYAICALQEYCFEPEEDSVDFYGIFDFGGGTTDFDFGIWRCSEGKEEQRYDYVIEHFGAGGDQYLGGENLLELLAFHVFKENKKKLLEAQITFFKPYECREFAGSERLLSDSQEAKLNMKQLMEKLRGLWENNQEETVQEISEGKIKLLLFTSTGETEANFELDVEKEKLMQILTERIEKGVRNFFDALKLNFSREDISRQVNHINIFLAGNASRSPIVRELFTKYMNEQTEEINLLRKSREEAGEELIEDIEDEERNQYFTLFPPLGTEEALEIQQKRGAEIDEDDLTRPTGKTGVAFGLIDGRQGSRIKVISEIKSTDEIKFKYYLGYSKRKKFHVQIDRNVAYQEWKFFIDASGNFELYYTSLPTATTNKIPIKEISKKILFIDEVNEDANIYIRVVEPTVIEYAVATEQGIKRGELLSEVSRVVLG